MHANSNMRMSGYVEGFIIARSYAPRSAQQRRVLLTRFTADTGDPYPADLTYETIIDWWAGLEGLAVASRAAHHTAVRTFLDHLVAIDIISTNPMVTISRPRVHPSPPVVLSVEEVRDVLQAPTTATDRAIISLMLGSGLRSSDVAGLRIEDVDHSSRTARVLGKGNKVRLVPVPRVALDAVRVASRGRTHGLLIECGSMTLLERTDYVRVRAQAVLMVAGVKQHALDGRSPHVLRRTFATTLIDHGVPVTSVQQILGHESLDTTMRYVARSEVSHLAEAIEAGPLAA